MLFVCKNFWNFQLFFDQSYTVLTGKSYGVSDILESLKFEMFLCVLYREGWMISRLKHILFVVGVAPG